MMVFYDFLMGRSDWVNSGMSIWDTYRLLRLRWPVRLDTYILCVSEMRDIHMDLTVYRALAFSPSLHPKRIFNFSIKCANGTWTRTTGLSLKKPIRYLYSEIAVWICFNILHHRFKRSLEVLKRRKALVILLDYIALTKGSTILSISSPNEYC